MWLIRFNFNDFIFYRVSATAWQPARLPAAYAWYARLVAGGCDWPLPRAVGLSNNDVIALRFLRLLRQFRYIPYVPYVTNVASLACIALDGNYVLVV